MAIFNSLTFAGVNSLDYGIYITGEAVYNAPTRSVEMVSIPGRDGDLVLDNGHFENIEVTYPAGCFGDDQTAFATRVRNFRNAVASKLGYQRLTDTYNTNEYRLALFVGGLEVEPVSYGRAGEFELVFNCKPFRYLMNGETSQTITSGQDLYNPTLFDSKPLLMVEGYGDIHVGDQEISLIHEPLRNIDLLGSWSGVSKISAYYSPSVANVDDEMTFVTLRFNCSVASQDGTMLRDTGSRTDKADFDATISRSSASNQQYITITASPTLPYLGEESKQRIDVLQFTVGDPISPTGTATVTITTSVAVQSDYIEILWSAQVSDTSLLKYNTQGVGFTRLTVDSTADTLGHPTYIDCDIGEAYKIVNDEYVSLNGYIDLGSDLPALNSGSNEITFDNTITSLEIVPRWRQL